MRLHLGGHLNWYDAQRRTDVEVRLAERMPLLDLLHHFFFNDTATTEIYTLSLNDALAIWRSVRDYVPFQKKSGFGT